MLSGALSFRTARQVRDLLQSALEQHQTLEVDLLNVTELDTAGAQLLLALRRDAKARGKQLGWLGFSLAVSSVVDLLDLTDALGRPGAVVWG